MGRRGGDARGAKASFSIYDRATINSRLGKTGVKLELDGAIRSAEIVVIFSLAMALFARPFCPALHKARTPLGLFNPRSLTIGITHPAR
jgi:hypothetical protein